MVDHATVLCLMCLQRLVYAKPSILRRCTRCQRRIAPVDDVWCTIVGRGDVDSTIAIDVAYLYVCRRTVCRAERRPTTDEKSPGEADEPR